MKCTLVLCLNIRMGFSVVLGEFFYNSDSANKFTHLGKQSRPVTLALFYDVALEDRSLHALMLQHRSSVVCLHISLNTGVAHLNLGVQTCKGGEKMSKGVKKWLCMEKMCEKC